jgi:hypothetical protein
MAKTIGDVRCRGLSRRLWSASLPCMTENDAWRSLVTGDEPSHCSRRIDERGGSGLLLRSLSPR